MAINYNKMPPGVIIYEHEVIAEMLQNLSLEAVGIVFRAFLVQPWTDKETEAGRVEGLRDELLSVCGEAETFDAIPVYKLLLSGARRSLTRYRKQQEYGAKGGNIAHGNID